MAPNKTLAAQLYAELREFFPENAIEYFVSYYDYYQPEAYVPSRDLYHREGLVHQRAHRADAPVRDQVAAASGTTAIIVATVSAIYGIGDPSDYHSMILHLRENDTTDPARRHQAPDRNAVPAQRHRISPRHVSGAVATCSTSSRRKAPKPRFACRFSMTRSNRCQLFDPLTGHIRQKLSRFTVLSVQPLCYAAGTRCSRRSRTIKIELAQQKDAFHARA